MLLGGSGVDVEGEHALAGVGGDPAVASGVCSEIPGPRTGHPANELPDKAGLVGRRRVHIARVVGVVSPFGPRRSPVEALDRRTEVADERGEAIASDPRGASRLAIVDVARVALLRSGVQVDVRQEAEVEARAPRQELRGELERHAVDLGAEKVRQANVAPGHQRERRQEVLAELAVRHPRRAVLVRFERQ